jgi:phage terminase small subunit
MGDSECLTTKKRRFVAALLASPTIVKAAETAGVSETTAWRYLSDSTVRREVADRQGAMLAQASAGVVGDMAKAREVLCDVMANELASAASRVSAARAILECGLRLFELVTLADRVAILEDRMGEVNGG